MNYQYPDRISVEVTEELEVVPKHAVLEIVIEGESSVLGDEAFRKSKEVAAFIKELQSINYSDHKIKLENISIQTNTGKILKSSMARFTLVLDEIPLNDIAKILSICATQKNIEIQDMEYYFGSLAEEKSQLLSKACLNSKQQGTLIIEEFGIDLKGVYSMNQKWRYPSTGGISRNPIGLGGTLGKSRGVPERVLDGLDFTSNYRGKLELTLKVEFRVGEFK